MGLAAFYAPDDIPEALFLQDKDFYPDALAPLAASKLALRDALGVLADLSLIDFDETTRRFSVHRLVQAAAREALGDAREAWALSAVVVLGAAMPQPAPATWEACTRLARHALALAPHAPANELTADVARHVGATGDAMTNYVPLGDALQFFRAYGAIFDRLAKADPGNAGWQRDLSVSHNKIGNVLRAQGNLPAALDAFKASLAIRDRLAKADPGNAGRQRDLSVSHDRIGDVLRAQGNLPAALDAFKASHAIFDRLAQADPGNAGWQRDLSVSHDYIGRALEALGRVDDALVHHRADLEIAERLARADTSNAGWQQDAEISRARMKRLGQ
jgi:tetratricopeptide (TPR) repeat protein